MTKSMVGVFSVFAAVMAVSTASAKVVPVHEYQLQRLNNAIKPAASCATYGYLTQTQKDATVNATCTTHKLFDGTTCYSCSCPSTFQYTSSQCSQTGFTAPSSTYKCNDGKNVKYSKCECSSSYIDSTKVTLNLSSIIYPTPKKLGTTTCYEKAGFKCKSGYKTFTNHPVLSSKNHAITYLYHTPYTDSVKCVYDYEATKGKFYTAIPNGATCHRQYTVYLSLLPSPKTLYYYNGCSGDDGCSTAASTSCVVMTQRVLDGTTCYEPTGCAAKLNGKLGLCVTASDSKFTAKPVTSGDISCSMLVCPSGYTQVCLGLNQGKGSTITPLCSSADSYKTVNGMVYDVRLKDSGTGRLVCRSNTATGCATGNIDYDSYWGGYLAWWK